MSSTILPSTQATETPPLRFLTLPNAITLTSLNLGALAIVAALVDGGRAGVLRGAVFVLLGAVCDFLDGRVARATGQSNALGAQLDSFADFVTFGLAPAALLYAAGLNMLGFLGLAACATYATATALRLARFNVLSSSGPQAFFQGLPSSAAAVTMSMAVLAVGGSAHGTVLLALLAPAVAFAMISQVRFPTFKLGLPLLPGIVAVSMLVALGVTIGAAPAMLCALVAYLVLGVHATWPSAAAELRALRH